MTIHKIFSSGLLFFLILTSAFAQYDQQQTEQTLHQLYQKLSSTSWPNTAKRIEYISAQFLGKPYELGALGEGKKATFDQMPLYRTDAFDCETYVDTVLALALADNLGTFYQRINQIRYDQGQISYINRNHFTCLDWNKHNQNQGFIQDITATFRDHGKNIVQYATAMINKPNWYAHFNQGKIRVAHVNDLEKTKRLLQLQAMGQKLPKTLSTIPYIPLTALFNAEGQANLALFQQIPNAAIIEIVRPNWDLTQQIGTHLNISHLGFAIWKQGVLYFRQASTTAHQVVDVPLIEYLRQALKSPTIKGINVHVVMVQD